MYYNNPGTLIPVLLNIYHSPNANKANKKIINKFKQIIEYNKNNTTNKKSLNISKANFYLRKVASNSQKNKDLQRNAVKILTLDLNQRSDLPYVYTYIKSKGKAKSEHPLCIFPML